MELTDNSTERESPETATQQEMLQLLAEVEKITVFGDDMASWGKSWGTADVVEDIDNGFVGSAKHKHNPDLPPISCKFDRLALHGQGRRLLARLTMDDHTYDFFLVKNDQLADGDCKEGTFVSSALYEMWHCNELYSVTYDESGKRVPRDPNEPVYMPAANYSLNNAELLEVYVDLPPDRRKLARLLAQTADVLAEAQTEEDKADEVRLLGLSATWAADHNNEAREFEISLGVSQIDSITARQLAKSLAEDYTINVRW